MPFFLFMVGCSMSLAFRRVKAGLLAKVLKRTAKLFIIGLLTQGAPNFPGISSCGDGQPPCGYGVNLETVRIPGILQRIAWAYLCVASRVAAAAPLPEGAC